MKNIKHFLISAVVLGFFTTQSLYAEKSPHDVRASVPKQSSSATCLPASNSNELTINNVRAYIETNGTMWFRETAQYEVPRGSGQTSMFAAAIWIGGRDVNQQIKLAAVRFRQVGDDFWTGPLTLVGATVSQATCSKYDRHYKMTRAEVEAHIAAFDDEGNKIDMSYVTPPSIKNWPAHGDTELGQSYYLAPFKERGAGNGVYEPEAGDYPYYDLDNELCPWTEQNKAAALNDALPHPPEYVFYEKEGYVKNMRYADHVLKGDETLFWIFNDRGNAHTETGGASIGIEVRAQAFAFATNDELNNMTFYSYEVINRSTFNLTNTYFSQWVDPDLGYSHDDYVGCDVARGLGYCYNGYDIDGTGQNWAYGSQPPAIGVDFFQGPYIDDDGVDNAKFYADSALLKSGAINTEYCNRFLKGSNAADQMAINGVNFGDGIPDNERFGMRRFVYHENTSDGTNPIGDPKNANDYYYMLQGIWKDGNKMAYGGNAHPQKGAGGPDCDFMFPALTDVCNWGTQGIDPDPLQYGPEGWTEVAAGNPPGDRRFMQSAGPFLLKAGAVNYITVGVPWARASQGGAWASVELLKKADDKCQSLFENCFKVLDGPDAPDLTIRELENQLVIFISNDKGSNNYKEQYIEFDNTISAYRENTYTVVDSAVVVSKETGNDTTIYMNRTVVDKIENDPYYRFEGYMIYQLKDKDVSVTDLDNPDKAQLVAQCDIKNGASQLVNWIYNEAIQAPVATEMVSGENAGIKHSFAITEDMFAQTARQLVNHKTYYYMAVAYAYNEYAKFSTSNGEVGLQGQQVVFLSGRKNIKTYSAIPHKTTPEASGTVLNAKYGTQPMITRIEGQGNGGKFLDISKETREQILQNNSVSEITYLNNYGPLDIRVIDPLKVQPYDYYIRFIGDNGNPDADVTDSTTWEIEIIDNVSTADLDAMGLDSKIISSELAIGLKNEQLLLPLGLSVSIENYTFQVHQEEVENYIAGEGGNTYTNLSKFAQVDLIGSSIIYTDSTKQWLSGLADFEGDYGANWIRAGQQNMGNWTSLVKGDYTLWKQEDFAYIFSVLSSRGNYEEVRGWKDPNSQFENIISGTWAPYVLTSPFNGGLQAKYTTPDNGSTEPANPYYDPTGLGGQLYCPGFNQTMTNLYSVDIVFTDDKSKWTRCVVLEACDDATLLPDGNLKLEPKKTPSINKEGEYADVSLGASEDENSPNYISATGMGWFPGYAVNIETGERLNIMFAENSTDTLNNGHDMKFNPTSVHGYYVDETTGDTTVLTVNNYTEYVSRGFPVQDVWGGKHFVYVCGSSGNTAPVFYNSLYAKEKKVMRNFNDKNRQENITSFKHGGKIGNTDLPYYECGPYDQGRWLITKFNSYTTNQREMRKQKMQIFNNVMWSSISMPTFGQEDNWLSTEATVKIRVTRPYMRYHSRWFDDPSNAGHHQVSKNNGFPMYKFTTKNIAPSTTVADVHSSILDEINVVPNPYYGFSTYESTALETYAKIVNVPEKCTVSIYTINGTLVRRISKGDVGTTYVDWDLKNQAGIPVAGGVYIIHVKAPGIGERTLKFFCAMRPTDLNAF